MPTSPASDRCIKGTLLRLLIAASAIAAAGVGAGCPSAPPATGDIYVSLLTHTDWNRYHYRFQPQFTITEADAYTRAVSDTAQVERSTLDAVKTAIRLKAAGGEFAETDSPAGLDPGDPSAGENIASRIATAAEDVLDPAALGVDARLRYMLATALWQEVQMLNRYIVDASIESGYAPFIVRLKLTNMPHHNRASYNALVELAFTAADAESGGRIVDRGRAVKVVPLLINDQVEAAIRSHRIEELRQSLLAISAVFKGIGVGGDTESIQAELNRSLYRSFNSLLTVGCKRESVLVARLGARYAPLNDGPEMVATDEPRALTVLVLIPLVPRPTPIDKVPTQQPLCQIMQQGQGQSRDQGDQAKRTLERKDADRVALTVTYSATLVDPSTGRVIAPFAGSAAPEGHLAPQLTGADCRIIELPRRAWIKSVQTAYGVDDGQKTLFRMNAATGIDPDDVQATWFFAPQGGPVTHAISAERTIYDGERQQLVFEFPSLKQLGLREPKPGAVAAYIRAAAIDNRTPEHADQETAWTATPDRSFVIRLNPGVGRGGDDVHLFYPWVYATSEPALADGFRVTTNRRTLVPGANGTSTIDVHVTLPTTPDATGAPQPVPGFKLLVDGADVTIRSANPPGAASASSPPAAHIELLKSGTTTLELSGLHKDLEVTLSFKPPEGYRGTDPLKLTVK